MRALCVDVGGMKRAASLPLIFLFVLPLLTTLLFVLSDAFDLAAWRALFQHPQLVAGLELSLATGTSATLISIVLALLIAAIYFERGKTSKLSSQLGLMLAVPHLAFAIGFAFLMMPSGLLARILAIGTGWLAPPQWTTTHDPHGIALTTALVAKETAFLLFVLVGVLMREDITQSFNTQRLSAFGLGHSPASAWLRVLVPQLVPHLIWPMIIVLVYASTVVDMSLVLGPTQPPVFADVIWVDINSADPANNARGAAGAVFISVVAALVLAAVFVFTKAAAPLFKTWATRGPSKLRFPALRDSRESGDDVPGGWIGAAKWLALRLFYAAVISTLILLSFAALWPFPNLLPAAWSTDAWGNVAAHLAPLMTSLVLAITTSITALAIWVAWLENVSQRFDQFILTLCVLVLGLPALLIGLGQYQMFLLLHLTGTWLGLYLAHLLPVMAYMYILLSGPYRRYETKWRDASTGLMATPFQFLFGIKWPMLKAPLLSSAAVGFAVSFAQFVPAQLVAAGRYSTLPIEAVTLSSGSNRALTAAFALLLMTPPLVVFSAGSYFGRSRWRTV